MACISGLAMGGASLFGASEQAGGEQQAMQFQQNAFNTVQKNLQPYMQAGGAAIPGVENLLGLGPNGMAGAMSQLQSMPGYQFALQQGLQGTQNGFAAQGLGTSGAAMKGGANYAEGLASTTYQQQLGNMMNLMSTGLNAAAGVGSAAQTAAQGMGQAAVGAGNAWAQGSTNAMAALTGMGNQNNGMYGNSGTGLFG